MDRYACPEDQDQFKLLSIASDGGAGTPVPDISNEVSDIHLINRRAVDQGLQIIYPLTAEDWGVRRFVVRATSGRVIDSLTHQNPQPEKKPWISHYRLAYCRIR
ncbi:MAG: hypothetical protein AAGF59_13990 [Pseudomonadota bacterium]